MAEFRITCTTKRNKEKHDHITSVGIYGEGWSIGRVYAAMDEGDRFYTADSEGVRASVEKYYCRECDFETLRSGADKSLSNNLDRLHDC